jgi:hypothetical protein
MLQHHETAVQELKSASPESSGDCWRKRPLRLVPICCHCRLTYPWKCLSPRPSASSLRRTHYCRCDAPAAQFSDLFLMPWAANFGVVMLVNTLALADQHRAT